MNDAIKARELGVSKTAKTTKETYNTEERRRKGKSKNKPKRGPP